MRDDRPTDRDWTAGLRDARGAIGRFALGPRASLALALAGCALFHGCALFYLAAGASVSLATEPPGARVVVDQKDSGFVTPCQISLSRERHDVDLELSGYATAKIRIDKGRQHETVLWRDMTVPPGTWRSPTWLNLEDAVDPFKRRPTLSPGHVFVRLERAVEAAPPPPPSTEAERTSAVLRERASAPALDR